MCPELGPATARKMDRALDAIHASAAMRVTAETLLRVFSQAAYVPRARKVNDKLAAKKARPSAAYVVRSLVTPKREAAMAPPTSMIARSRRRSTASALLLKCV